MKATKFILSSELIRDNAISAINNIELNGKTQVTISDVGAKSARQRALNWMWNNEVAESGIGGKHEDTAEGVHLVAKYRWALPILQRDDEHFASLYDIWVQLYKGDEERMLWFIDKQVHTEAMSVSQNAEFLTMFQRFYQKHGVSLTDPELKLLEVK